MDGRGRLDALCRLLARDAIEARMGRRAFGQWLAGAALAGVTPGCVTTRPCPKPAAAATPPPTTTPATTHPARVAIVGAGLAGLHCAYRLREVGVRATVFEAWDRVGGRVYTDTTTFAPQVVELGGEFLDSDHVTMRALCAELGLTLEDLWTAQGGAQLERDVFWSQNKRIPRQSVATAFAPLLAELAATLKAVEASDARFDAVDAMSVAAWLTRRPKPLDPLVLRLLDNVMKGEFGMDLDDQSALNLVYRLGVATSQPFDVIGKSDERWHIVGGNERLIRALAAPLADQIVLGAKLVRLKWTAGGRYRLSIERGGATTEALFDHVVLALPFTALRQVDLSVYELSPQRREIIDELGYGQNTKLMAGFRERVWATQHRARGSAYTDTSAQVIWEPTRAQEGAAGVLTVYLGGSAAVRAGQGSAAQQVAAHLGELERLYPGARGAFDGRVGRMHWPGAPHHKGSYVCYEPGQWDYFGKEGARVGNLHFCGSHCSQDFQGYMEGAAETGAFAAMEVMRDLGLKPGPKMRQALAYKLLVPQPWTDPVAAAQLRPLARRRLVSRAQAHHAAMLARRASEVPT